MNSMEERARAAVRATASEIGPGDVPPMRAPGSGDRRGAGRGPGRGAGRRRAAWQWGAPLAAAAAVVAVIAATTLVGGGSRSPASRPGLNTSKAAASTAKTTPAPRKHAAPGYPPNLEAGMIGFFLPASGAQYTAGALFTGEYRSLGGKITSNCMVHMGFPATGTARPAEIARAFWDLSQFPDLGAIAKAGMLPSYSSGPTPRETKAYQKAFTHCFKAGEKPFNAMVSAGFKFGNPFTTTVSQIQESAPVTATLPALRTCAAHYGWPNSPYGPARPINSFSDFVDWIAGHIDGADSRGAAASQMNNLNRHWGTVFVKCARPTVAVMERLQLAAQAKFLAEHQGQFAALVKLARASFARAERLARG